MSMISPELVASSLRTTKAELAETLGLGRGALIRKERIESVAVQTRLREFVEILNMVGKLLGQNALMVPYAWFRSEPLPGLGLQTPDQLVREGKAALVKDYLTDLAYGVYA
jgi:uncharacterized protein (DUF2384 family)